MVPHVTLYSSLNGPVGASGLPRAVSTPSTSAVSCHGYPGYEFDAGTKSKAAGRPSAVRVNPVKPPPPGTSGADSIVHVPAASRIAWTYSGPGPLIQTCGTPSVPTSMARSVSASGVLRVEDVQPLAPWERNTSAATASCCAVPKRRVSENATLGSPSGESARTIGSHAASGAGRPSSRDAWPCAMRKIWGSWPGMSSTYRDDEVAIHVTSGPGATRRGPIAALHVMAMSSTIAHELPGHEAEWSTGVDVQARGALAAASPPSARLPMLASGASDAPDPAEAASRRAPASPARVDGEAFGDARDPPEHASPPAPRDASATRTHIVHRVARADGASVRERGIRGTPQQEASRWRLARNRGKRPLFVVPSCAMHDIRDPKRFGHHGSAASPVDDARLPRALGFPLHVANPCPTH